MWTRDGFTISTDHGHLDIDAVWRFLHDEAYWSKGVPREVVERAIAASLCFGLFEGDPSSGHATPPGFARVVTDGATFAWLCDVFVLPRHRGRGLGEWLVGTVVAHPDLQAQRMFVLATRDAHGLYEKFGFTRGDPGRFMRIVRPYQPAKSQQRHPIPPAVDQDGSRGEMPQRCERRGATAVNRLNRAAVTAHSTIP